MSASLRLYERFTGKIETACAEGRSKELLDAFFQEIAGALADAVFLRIETEANALTKQTVSHFLKWADSFSNARGLELIEAVTTTLQEYNANEAEIKDAQDRTAQAYQDRLDFLFEAADHGGVA